MDKIVKDGKVAVLVSYGYGAGWYSWNHSEDNSRALLFDPQLVGLAEQREAAQTAEEREAVQALIEARGRELVPDGYFGGARDLCVEWLPVGAIFRVDEYDGAERLVVQDDDDWIAA